MKASFNGDIPEIPGIAVDNFVDTGKRAYFLSHCHADHVTGLDALYYRVNTKSVFIYMSEPSAAIVETYIFERLKKFIKPLKLGVSYETFPKRSETMDSVVREIENWLASGDMNRVALVPSARYGYEYVFNEIYRRMDMKIGLTYQVTSDPQLWEVNTFFFKRCGQ
ncbi:putative Artemis protein [Operophtera brumata]|uniref:Putative Artemis protein n=1 Tax=Operophtera brumata TaxID=104452 RepID=A0A0L7LHI7_OPEBR|nr:putative Artemis protein [Operophtera brumata]